MASSLLDRVKRPPQSAETFIAAADAPQTRVPTPAAVPPPISSDTIEPVTKAVQTEPSASPPKAHTAPRARHAPE
jgi:hypothetical protein